MSRFWRFILVAVLIPAAFSTTAASKESAVFHGPLTVVPYEDTTGLLIIPVAVGGKTYRLLYCPECLRPEY